MKKILRLLSILPLNAAQAAGTVDFLEVDNDVVLFSTSSAKVAASPACVATETANLWTVSLASDSGRAIYSLILTSMAKSDGVALNIESAQDCADKAGFERASKVNLVADSNSQSISSGGYSVGLYKSDGVTRVGTYLGDSGYRIFYINDAPQTVKMTFGRQTNNYQSFVFFTGTDCTGDAWVNKKHSNSEFELQRNEGFANGDYFDADLDTKQKPVTNSYISTSSCIVKTDSTDWRYKPIFKEHSICGRNLCTLKQD